MKTQDKQFHQLLKKLEIDFGWSFYDENGKLHIEDLQKQLIGDIMRALSELASLKDDNFSSQSTQIGKEPQYITNARIAREKISLKDEGENTFTGRSERIIKQKHCFGPLCPYSVDPRSQCEWFDPEGEIFTCFTNKQPECHCQGINCGYFKQIKYNFTTGL